MTLAEINAALAGDDMGELLSVASHLSGDHPTEVDYSTAERILCLLGRHANKGVRGKALHSLGRLAYRTQQLDAPGVVFNVILEGLRDEDPSLVQRADYAACCLAYLQGWKFPDRRRRRG